MKYIYSFIIVLFLVSFTSCEDYLEVKPYYAYSDADAITDLITARYAANAVYTGIRNDNLSSKLYAELASKSGFVKFYTDSWNLDYTEANDPGEYYWNDMYEALNYANFAIQGIMALPSNESERDEILAEVRCARAFIHTYIFWNFGHWWAEDDDIYGILYRDQPADLSNTINARLTVGESYAKIYEDLDYAIEYMNDLTSPRYMSKQFAQALKAKLLLYRGAYNNINDTEALTEALALVNDIMANAPSSFVMEADMQELYDNSWDSKENLFCKYLEDGEHEVYFDDYFIGRYGDRSSDIENEEHTAGVVYGLDWFKEDPRWPIVTGVAPYYTNSTRQVYAFTKLYRLGRYQGQLLGDPYDKWTSYHFRYAELYIMKAELLARTGSSISEAIAPINEMRANRTNPILESLNPTSESELMDLIFKEYWMELGMENGSEFFASLRFYKDGQPYIVATKEGLPLKENAICWPIPEAEIENNPLMIQNIGLE